jgi:uncharacterized protein YecE (DUF72 family)
MFLILALVTNHLKIAVMPIRIGIFLIMKFGKLPSVENVDFTLPPDPPGTLAILQKLKEEGTENTLYIGATGWGMKEWVGTVYPKNAKPKDYLEHYAKQFNTIELNSTHYGIPDELTIQKWYGQATADFRFCPKVLQRISHSRELSPDGPVNFIKQFCETISGFKEKLGSCFIQLPPYFGIDRLPTLAMFLEKWSAHEIPISVEVRHESWFAEAENLEQLAAVLEQYGASTVITDVAGRRDVCHARLTSNLAVIRFVGNGLHPTDFTRIDAWVEKLKHWFENGLKAAYFFTHEPDNVLAPDLAVYLTNKIREKTTIQTRGPEIIGDPKEGQQMSLF